MCGSLVCVGFEMLTSSDINQCAHRDRMATRLYSARWCLLVPRSWVKSVWHRSCSQDLCRISSAMLKVHRFTIPPDGNPGARDWRLTRRSKRRTTKRSTGSLQQHLRRRSCRRRSRKSLQQHLRRQVFTMYTWTRAHTRIHEPVTTHCSFVIIAFSCIHAFA